MRRHSVVCVLAVVGMVLCSPAVRSVTASTCTLQWDAVSTTMDGGSVPAAEVIYRVYVVPIHQPFVPGEARTETPETTIACDAVGFVSGMQAAVTAVHAPTGEESARSNVLIRLTLTSPVNLHIEYAPTP